MEQSEFLARYIRPFYMDLMKMNFVEKSEDYTISMFNKLKSLVEELSDEQLKSMLNDFWRPSKVGAWMIGLGNRINLKLDLENFLSKTPSDYSEHALMNYFILTKEKSGLKLIEFIERQIKYFSVQKVYVEFDNLSIQWALAILRFMDEKYDQKNIDQIESSIWWMEFINGIKGTRYSDQIIQLLESNYYLETIRETVKRIKKDDNNR